MSTYQDRDCSVTDGLYTGDEIPYIDQKTIECNLTRFTAWLNRLVDQVNYLSCLYLDLKTMVLENRERIICLESRVDRLEERVTALEERVTTIEEALGLINTNISNLTNAINNLTNNISQVAENVSRLYSYLPTSITDIDNYGWKFGMGNINVMSANSGTPAISGPGIFTSAAIENNDIYFN